jgi:hypothetical protein
LTNVLNCVKIGLHFRQDRFVAFGRPIMKTFLILFIATILFSFTVYATTYKWVDDKGVVNYTDDPDKIPAKYLKRVKKLPSTNAEGSPNVPAEKVREKTQTAPGAEPVVQNKEKLFGGHDENWWHSSFSGLHNELKEIEDALPGKKDELVALRRKMTIYQAGRDRKAYYDKLAEIEKDESRIKELNEQLNALDAEASKAGVPFEWRH